MVMVTCPSGDENHCGKGQPNLQEDIKLDLNMAQG